MMMPLNVDEHPSKVEMLIRLVQSDILTLDEARKELGYDGLPDELGRFTLSMYLNLIDNMQQEEEFLDVDPNLN
jgi:hypothetical protein